MRLFKALVMPLLLGGLVFNFSIVNAEEGVASWYGHPYHGRTAANGTTYNMYEMTAAHKKLPFGTKVKVINKRNNKSVIVEITDRGPFIEGRVIDLSLAAARKLKMETSGLAPVEVQVLEIGDGKYHRN